MALKLAALSIRTASSEPVLLPQYHKALSPWMFVPAQVQRLAVEQEHPLRQPVARMLLRNDAERPVAEEHVLGVDQSLAVEKLTRQR